MSSPSGQPSPTLRLAGIGLIAVALVILVIGAVGVLSDGDDTTTTAQDTTASTTAPAPSPSGTASGEPSPTSSAPSPTSSAATSTTAPTPTTGSAPAATAGAGSDAGTAGTGAGSGPGSVDFAVPVRVFNNSTVTGLAASAAARLQSDGWESVSTGNYQQGVIPTTTVYYRPGTAEQTAADQIASTLGVRAEPRFAGLTDASPGVILIVTDDFAG